MPSSNDKWFIYMIRCHGGQLYTGITTDVERRFGEHQQGKGAKFLRGKQPLQLVFSEKIGNRSEALKMELTVKKLRRSEKELLIQQGAIKLKD